MTFDSSLFDVRLFDSCKIDVRTPLVIGDNLLTHFENLIQALPEDEHILEVCIRSIVNILIISKLQSDEDRFELDQAKELITNGRDRILKLKPVFIGDLRIVNIDRWSIFSLKPSNKRDSFGVCDDISSVIDEVGHLPHVIFDLSGCTQIDLNLTAYLIGLRDMLEKSRRKMSLAWLHSSAVSAALLSTLTTRFNLYRKGAFLLSSNNSFHN